MRDHVLVPRALELPRAYRQVAGYLQRHDADLRLRRSIERPWYWVLERRVRRAPAVNRGMRVGSDMHLQARDGYLHVALVHPAYLSRPWRILEALVEQGADLWAAGGASKVEDEDIYERKWQKETRRRRRKQMFSDLAREQFDILSRTGFPGSVARSRISNAGIVPTAAPAV